MNLASPHFDLISVDDGPGQLIVDGVDILSHCLFCALDNISDSHGSRESISFVLQIKRFYDFSSELDLLLILLHQIISNDI